MYKVLGFDVYGTLIDTAGVVSALSRVTGDPHGFSALWRSKQLEYTWRYSLMGTYRDFRYCTRQALDFCCEHLHEPLDSRTREELLAGYLELPVFPDVAEGVQRMQAAGLRLRAFSNGLAEDVHALLENAGIRPAFEAIISVDAVRSYKPDPRTYRYFIEQADCEAADCCLISSNAFDVQGARSAGMPAIWVRRDPKVCYDPGAPPPSAEVPGFAALVEHLLGGYTS